MKIEFPDRHAVKIGVINFPASVNNKEIVCQVICQHFIGQKIYNLTNHFKT